MALSPNPIDLTTVAAVKAWLGDSSVTTNDQMQRTVTAVSRFILNYLSRSILPATHVERYDGLGGPSNRQMLKQWPVISIIQASIGNTLITAAPIPGPGSSYGSGYLLSPGDDDPGIQQFLDFPGWCLPRGSQNIGITYRAGYATSESVAIPGAPYQIGADALAQLFGVWATDEGVKINGVTAVRVTAAPTTGQYMLTVTAGVPTYTFAAADTGKTAIISYGYIPQDLAQAALEMIAYRYKSRDFIGYVSKSLGSQETVTFSQKDMSDAVATMLQNYRRVF
jgi:hypothetical protein